MSAQLHANRIQWLIRFCVVRCYVSVMWRAGVHRVTGMCLLCGGLVCTVLRVCVCYVEGWCAPCYEYVSVMWRADCTVLRVCVCYVEG
jgi:hypothetical protein